MKLINLVQGSESWKTWRRKKLCGSDASSILGVNPFKSMHKLYEEKVFGFEQEDNENMRRGRELEPIALEAFEKEFDLIMMPMVVQHDELDWMAASLDGMTLDQSQFVEIKCGKKAFFFMEAGEIAKYYYAQ